MDCSFTTLTYQKTGYFTSLITDYLAQKQELSRFYQHPVSLEGIKQAMEARKQVKTDRQALVKHLHEQYKQVSTSAKVIRNINLLQESNTFTVCTAHQPALFTGTLYFVYKILHAIRLADTLTKQFPGNEFIPVYWMGSEDADLDELGKFYLGTEKITWNTTQTGAVGRMNTKGIDKLLHRIEGELSVQPFGKELMELLRKAYREGDNIQTATFRLLDSLFQEYGLIVLIPDTAILKKQMQAVFEDDLYRQMPSAIVSDTIRKFPAHYKIQANPREVNLFYLKDDVRGRIEKIGDTFKVHDSDFQFTPDSLRQELHAYPERFSPNVILRGLYQETILPNIAFIGGGGETAYWLELKSLFEHYNVPFPVLVLRNSFLVTDTRTVKKIERMGFSLQDFFQSEEQLLNILVTRNKNGQLKLEKEKEEALSLYSQLKEKAGVIDQSLKQHVEALQAKALKPLEELEKKMLRAEKRKYETEQRQLHAIKSSLFPLNGLQERIENFMPYYARYGEDFLKKLYEYSLSLEQEFGLLVIDTEK